MEQGKRFGVKHLPVYGELWSDAPQALSYGALQHPDMSGQDNAGSGRVRGKKTPAANRSRRNDSPQAEAGIYSGLHATSPHEPFGLPLYHQTEAWRLLRLNNSRIMSDHGYPLSDGSPNRTEVRLRSRQPACGFAAKLLPPRKSLFRTSLGCHPLLYRAHRKHWSLRENRSPRSYQAVPTGIVPK